ncbi:arylsulfatase [Terriglobus albidus]|uniref:Arylsulfatase n=2 Tax=Terriglobus albidus TaxID=1592106 RepID=A0A5B9E8X4_9BACT|nr:arylsulfatase [Terriglobus albidus]
MYFSKAKTLFWMTTCVGLGASATLIHAQPQRTPQTAAKKPNIVVIALDDVGFADLGCYGSEIATPSIDSIAKHGVRYTNFQTKAICSPTRAALLTGRNNQTVGMEDLPDQARPGAPPRSTGIIPANAEMLSEALRSAGYATFAVGKWHLTPRYQDGKPGNNSTMPLQRGFDLFYGYKMGWTDQYHPELFDGNSPVPDPYHPGYYLAEDLAEHAVSAMKKSQAEHPEKPMFLYLAFTFAHTPLQAPKEYIDHYKEIYQKGWDVIREERFARQKKMGIIPADVKLPPREAGDPSWNSLTDQQKRVYARFMATYAGYIEHGDAQIGKVLAYLKVAGIDKNTVVVLFSDNGAASESKTGSFHHAYLDQTSLADMDAHLDELGGPTTQPLYQRPWAYAGGTPFRRYKLWPYFGGTRTPMMIDYPGHIRDAGSFRGQMVDAIDVAPTLLQIAGTQFHKTVNGVEQIPVAGKSFLATITSAGAAAPRSVQFFEMRGNRAILSGDWRAVAMHKMNTPFDQDRWQLFNVKDDPTESTDLAQEYPKKLQEMKDLWQKEAEKYGDLPMKETQFSRGFADAFLD